MIVELPIIILRCLLFTIVIELIGSLLVKVKEKNDLINIILVNILTNPIVVVVPLYFNIFYGIKERNISLFILEILAFFVEGLLYKKYLKYQKINPYKLSFFLNFLSYFIGLIINNILY